MNTFENKISKKQSSLDILIIVTNVLFSILYVPHSLIGIFGAMMGASPPENFFAQMLLYTGIMFSIATPGFCFLSISNSVVLRKKRKDCLAF